MSSLRLDSFWADLTFVNRRFDCIQVTYYIFTFGFLFGEFLMDEWWDKALLGFSLIAEAIPGSAIVLFVCFGCFVTESFRQINHQVKSISSKDVIESENSSMAQLYHWKYQYVLVTDLVKKLNSTFGLILLLDIINNLVGLITDCYTIFFIIASPVIYIEYPVALGYAIYVFIKYLPTLYAIFFVADQIRGEVRRPFRFI